MDVSYLLNELNDAQREVVAAPIGNLLVLAGAGSGKTRVLVHRVAWLMQVEDVSPFSILAVTFTNKAAAEMRGRLEYLLAKPIGNMWVGTFHGLAHRLLRQHWQEAHLPQSFQILDTDDQYRLVRRILRELNLDEKQWSPKQAQWFINAQKDEGTRPHQLDAPADLYTKTLLRIYQAYQQACERSGLVDFAELLLRSYELLAKHPQVLAHYRQRFKHIVVDEFQDTNTIQYAWLSALAGSDNYFMAVGDDDQSIYGWRGAKIENIHKFRQDFPGTHLVRLEQNYRSTATILAAANSVIAYNSERLGKKLWTDGEQGEAIALYAAFNEVDEARFVVERIRDWETQGNNRKEAAILYRSNAQSRVIEEALIQAGMPYRVYGGLRFFDRAEIKDGLGYLRLLNNRNDDAAFERVVNTPTRGIGDKTLSIVREAARTDGIPLWQACLLLLRQTVLPARAHQALAGFIALIDTLALSTQELNLPGQIERVLQASGLFEHYRQEKGEVARARLENLEELVNAASQMQLEVSETLSPLAAFLAHVALESSDTQHQDEDNCVHLMTLHAAKGLEFGLVFMTGMEEGLFPSLMSAEEAGRIEEERRLCYVGMTRAMRKLYLSYAEKRMVHGSEKYHRRSRFIQEIPQDLVQEVRIRGTISRPLSYQQQAVSQVELEGQALSIGQQVSHSKFGEGIVLNFEGKGPQMRVQVKFAREGIKWLVAAYANLTVV
jgi:DNA helicase-2/ATP-dependent DNA helicase PcrA